MGLVYEVYSATVPRVCTVHVSVEACACMVEAGVGLG